MNGKPKARNVELKVKISSLDDNELLQSCINCLHFDEANELCKLCNLRPPARIIALSCDKYEDKDDIPF